MNIRDLVLILLAFTFPGLLGAQQTLTWNQCLEEASKRNLDLLAAQEGVRAAENAHLSSLGTFVPQLSLGASLGRSGNDGSLEDALANPNPGRSAGYSLSLRQNLFSGFRDFASVDLANAEVRSARARLTSAKAKLSRELTSAFYGLLRDQKLLGLLETIAERRRSNARLVELTYQGGKDNKGSFLQAQAASFQADHELAQARRNLRLSQRELSRLLDRDPLEPLEARGEMAEPFLPEEPSDFQRMARTTPAYLLALSQLHSAEGRLAQARSSFFPTLSANASLSKSGPDFGNLHPGWSAGLSLSFPILSGGSDLFDYQAAEDSKRAAGYGLRGILASTALDLESAYASLADAVGKVGVQRSFLEAARVRERIAKAEYLNGLLSFQNWDQIESELTNQEKAELSSLLLAVTAKADWELAQGKGDIP
jgi:outer membrane protein TolC